MNKCQFFQPLIFFVKANYNGDIIVSLQSLPLPPPCLQNNTKKKKHHKTKQKKKPKQLQDSYYKHN